MNQGGNYWTLFTPGIWKVLHAVFHSYRFNAAIASLRTTMIAADKAPGTPFFPAGDVTREEARDLHARWVSASCVMHAAVDDVTSRGAALIRAAEALFSP